MNTRYRTTFTLLGIIVLFFTLSSLLYRGMEHLRDRNDQAHRFSEAEALALEPQFTLLDSSGSLFRTLFSNDPDLASAGGPYLVLAGSFQTRARASQHRVRLKKLGYPQAEILTFNGKREIYAIGVGAYRTIEEARAQVERMQQRQGVDAYVHKVRKPG